ncbi:MAG: hypothetical protein ATN36_06695 [Epulopiscium sp. Nele67-Bin005]|nr:MAG: hypothetical protein ATN36_06695 [Epulopiscium sp. Nele67-Bin005]
MKLQKKRELKKRKKFFFLAELILGSAVKNVLFPDFKLEEEEELAEVTTNNPRISEIYKRISNDIQELWDIL